MVIQCHCEQSEAISLKDVSSLEVIDDYGTVFKRALGIILLRVIYPLPLNLRKAYLA